ncbi:MAG TPA: hypothetical protein PLZ12_07295 [Saprospiraceae bacterium]|nr:hypothetical protein [Saprospiraceae bacterium]
MKNSYFNNGLLRKLMAALFVFASISIAHAQFDGIEMRAGMNVTRPAEGADGKPFQLRTGWNSGVSAVWKTGRLSSLSAGISLHRLVFTETLTTRWGSDWPFNGEFTTYKTTSKLYDAGCTVMWRRSISQRLHRIAPAVGFTASRQWGPVTTLRISGRGDDLTLDHYDLPRFNLSALLGIQCTLAQWERNSIHIMPLYAYALSPVKSTSEVGATATYYPHYFSLQVAFQHKL